ncbi:MAG: cob(I)yrinic acid a,c-diamide adenosyltransferase [Candidatus Thorarchaeota archaeon]|nr:MAG: cob(I)yrinic acid a,c-diamide adenosyltransferase [Candidatus Thorarchaeota archaeon]RLI59453.1 MAG: cob(I)yrinic acid a,c-diamide adenosyltransferase [Candidatus Thorarchaeota archaeon]
MKDAGPGLVQLYTGNGKGKTTCALGAGLRAAGHGLNVLMISFMKAKVASRGDHEDVNYGEFRSIEGIPNFTIVPVGRETFVDKEDPDPVDIEMAQKGLRMAQRALEEHTCDVLILDEINVAVEWNLISLEDQLSLIMMKPPDVELIMTGRYARPEAIEAADLVTEMREIKHYYATRKILARKGFEF